MKVVIRNSWEHHNGLLPDARVFVDVFRASTTLSVILAQKVARVVSTMDPEEISSFCRQGYLLFSELISGGFDNSPVQARTLDLTGRSIVHRSTNLTAAVFGNRADGVRSFIGSFVNCRSLCGMLANSGLQNLELVPAGHFNRRSEAIEDTACVQLIKAILDGQPEASVSWQAGVRQKIEEKRLSGKTYSSHYWQDLEFALQVGLLDTIIEAFFAGNGTIEYRLVREV